MSFDADLNACATLVEKGDPERFAAAMASPVAARRILFPLYAFNVEVSRAPWVTQEPMIAEMRLQWWRDALEEIAAGQTVRRHEVVTPLSSVLDPESAKMLDALVAARRWDIYKDAFDDEEHFERYLDDTSAGLMWVAARGLHKQSDRSGRAFDVETETVVRGLGQATGLARFLRAVPALEALNRIPLVDGRPEAIKMLAQKALAGCAPRVQLQNRLHAPARAALTEAFLTSSILKQVLAKPSRVANDELTVSPIWRSFSLWRWS